MSCSIVSRYAKAIFVLLATKHERSLTAYQDRRGCLCLETRIETKSRGVGGRSGLWISAGWNGEWRELEAGRLIMGDPAVSHLVDWVW